MSGLRTTAAAVVLLLTLAACGGGAPASTASSDPPSSTPTKTKPTKVVPPPPAPKTGACRNVSYADISLYSNHSKEVPCGSDHTAYTFHVAELPSDVAFDGVEIKNDAVQQAAADACQSAYARFIGGDHATRALARLTVTYFLPEQKGFDAGAHWVRCDVVALQSATLLAPLPRNLESFLDQDNALHDFGVCSRGDPSTSTSELVMCTQDHTYRAVAAFRLGETGDRYPGQDETLQAGKQQCEDYIKQLLGVSGGFTYSWTYPSADDWSGGQRFGYCWNESSS
jgi:Septum formation